MSQAQGWLGGGLWLWAGLGALASALLVAVIDRRSRR